jgi:hypothetical protein
MPQYIERFAVGGSIDDVKKSVLSSLSEIGADNFHTDTTAKSIEGDEADCSDFPDFLIRTQVTARLSIAADTDKEGRNSDLHVEIDLSMLNESKTGLRIGVYLHSVHQFGLTQSCAYVADKITRCIVADWPTVELKHNPMQFSQPAIKQVSIKNKMFLFALIMVSLTCIFTIGILVVSQRNYEEDRQSAAREVDQSKQNVIFNHNLEPNSRDRSSPPELEFVLVSVTNSSGNPDRCTLRVDIRKPSRLQLKNLELVLVLINQAGWLIHSASVEFEIPNNNQIERHTRWINFSKEVCEHVDRIKIGQVPICAVSNQSFSMCRSLVKSDPKSIIPVEI